MSTVKIKKQTAVTPLGLFVAIVIVGVLLVGFAIPRLRAVSEERNRPEASPILSAYPAEGLPDSADGAVSYRVSGR